MVLDADGGVAMAAEAEGDKEAAMSATAPYAHVPDDASAGGHRFAMAHTSEDAWQKTGGPWLHGGKTWEEVQKQKAELAEAGLGEDGQPPIRPTTGGSLSFRPCP